MNPQDRPTTRHSLLRDTARRVAGLRRVYPFQRSWPVILITAAAAAGLGWPAISAVQDAVRSAQGEAGLAELVSVVFLGAWALGWSVVPLVITGALILMLFGREVLRAGPGVVRIGIGIPGLAFSKAFDPAHMRNLRVEQPTDKSGLSWRGPHFVFDYGPRTIQFGSAVETADLDTLWQQIETATGTRLRAGRLREEDMAEPEPPVVAEPAVSRAAPAAASKAVTLWSPSTLLLIAANLVPVAGALLFGWKLGEVMLLYWAESAVVGFWNLVKMAVIGRWQVLLAGPFFVGHFGGFMAAHFLFLYTLFIASPFSGGGQPALELSAVLGMFAQLAPALIALFLSHGISFFTNFIGRHEYAGRNVRDQMAEPYQRIVFMHLVLIFGGGASMVLGDSQLVLIVAILLKIAIDVRAHLKERVRGGAKATRLDRPRP